MECISYREQIHGAPPVQVLTAYMWVPGTGVHAVVPLPTDPTAQAAEVQHVRRQLDEQLTFKRRVREQRGGAR